MCQDLFAVETSARPTYNCRDPRHCVWVQDLMNEGVHQCLPHCYNPEKIRTALADSKVREVLEAIS